VPIISAFADEISPDPKAQMDALAANGIRHIELRGVWGQNVMTFSKQQMTDLKKMFGDRGFAVSCIASPIGKAKISDDYRKHFDAFTQAVDIAQFFDSRYIRIFSYYPPDGANIGDFRREVIDRLAEKVDYVENLPITLALENESNLFGAYPERCVYLHSAITSSHLVAAFDPANFVNMDVQDVYNTCWLPLRKHVGYFHIKDFKYGEKEHAVPAGQGDGDIPEILHDAAADGYDGFLALEPHLAKAEHSTGQTGPELFKVATDALKTILRDVGMETHGNWEKAGKREEGRGGSVSR
jgi:3-dehydroshikimate dehydratase